MPTARTQRTNGKRLESIVLRSPGIELVKVPNGVRWLRGGGTVPTKGPVDFLGVLPGGRAVAFDAKEGGGVGILETRSDHLPEHQRQIIVRFGQAGAVAGLLCLSTRRDRMYWCDWSKLLRVGPSVRWDDLIDIGPPTLVNWTKIVVS